MMFCADCGKKLYQVRGKTIPKEREHFVCSTYRKVKGGCSSHQIRNIIVEELLLEDLQKIVAFAKNHENEFIELVMNKTEKNLAKEQRQNQKDLDEAIKIVNSHPKPLALYFFSTDNEKIEKVIKNTSYGGGCINDTIMHLSSPCLPFGGVGNSGMGSYHGKQSFDTFTHYKSILKRSNAFDPNFRYPPYKDKINTVKKFLK